MQKLFVIILTIFCNIAFNLSSRL